MNRDKIKIFKNYVSGFNLKDNSISRKYKHSLRVMNLSFKLSKKLKLSKEDILLSETIGLLHDYGRFMQWNKYNTFSDLESIDHGDLGVHLLFENKDINKYVHDKRSYKYIKNAIKYHNKYSYPANLDKKSKLFCDIIRDTDKLDIINIYSKQIFKLSEESLEISEKIRNDFINKRSINRKDMKSDADHILLKLALIYDLNFKESFKYLYRKKCIWKFYKSLDNKDLFLEYFEYVNEFIKERMN